MEQPQRIYYFGEGNPSNPAAKPILGGKGVSLGVMTNLGMPVPKGFTISCQACMEYQVEMAWPTGLDTEFDSNMARLEKEMDMKFGSLESPLLMSVRSGAGVSMPGMMDTVLNIGLNDDAVVGLAKKTGNPRFAWDAFRRFMQMFGNVVMGMSGDHFEHAIETLKKKVGAKEDTDLTTENLKELVQMYRDVVKRETGEEFPTDPKVQLIKAINAVFDSWNNPRAVAYRVINKLPHNMGTAVNVQSMVFGNMGQSSGTGVGFTRDPTMGDKYSYLYGEFLPNAQGEDVVAGIRTPYPCKEMPSLGGVWPRIYDELTEIYNRLEAYYTDMVDLEFTIQEGKLWMLQARVGKRTGMAMAKIAIDQVKEGLITKEKAILRMDPNKLNEFLFPQFDPKITPTVIGSGIAASPGAAVGLVCFDPDRTVEMAASNPVVLCRIETSPEDITGMNSAKGILTARGGATSHAAVVARGMGKCCVAGAACVKINYEARTMTIGDATFKEGDYISINGSKGEIYAGKVPTVDPEVGGDFATIMNWSDEFRTMVIRTNADTPHDAEVAKRFGAQGIGLCRTEHMFFDAERIQAVREMILSKTTENREKALAKILPFQRDDFIGLFRCMDGKGVNIRLLDPPLHEFLPHTEPLQRELAEILGITYQEVHHRVEDLAECNPMLGFRGVRLGVVYPEISAMQVRAIMEAACHVKKEGGNPKPEIMIPVLFSEHEMKILLELAQGVIAKVFKETGIEVDHQIGTMIELPRACLTADKIAAHAEYFSFGTNDLTQTTFGISRDDSAGFVPAYVEKGIVHRDPFVTLDSEGVGALMRMAVEKGRSVRPGMKVGICGEQGGDADSADFLQTLGLTYASCSPFRVPIARLSLAKAALKARK
eukprot:gnl/Dysnectes_brevis/577_a639_6781.p1 GENE.gnl/Dysnectes_brevis/577_a639_6781~~gnl/Dysnectes_brevis/577_a639_6781.p1  ORF type:complete len:880 (-),score=385.74 gnl/Dysnectes_brevis/577_a639_6781:61-2700(-)